MRVAVFASGRGSDFLSLVEASEKEDLGWKVVLLLTNNPEAGAIEKAIAHNISYKYLNRRDFEERGDFLRALFSALEEHRIDFIALAGYLRKMPPEVVERFKGRIVNIHPALLPDFGGKGMYGLRVHQAVLDAGSEFSGITVHLVDEEYDRGSIVAQRTVPVLEDDDAETLAKRVLEVEHSLYPEVITQFAKRI
ncbi:MAG: phosphoribosylglycinamide formyltransferase [candidate division Zixibacteria bacterium]|nr:phosphoribosylglycinamide formyltransferase [Candidatus Tariuqbacter arcticus]